MEILVTAGKIIASALIAPIIWIAGYAGYEIQKVSDNDILGADTQLFVGGSTYTLSGSGITSSASSITLTSLTIPQNGVELVDANFASTFYATLEPGSTSRQEFISCTTVAQNSNGTATLSGCTRGLSPVSPYTASSTLQFAHSGGSRLIFSNPPQLYDQATFKGNDETITEVWTFDADEPPTLDETGKTATSSAQLISKEYADNLAIAGAPDSSATVKGIVEKAAATEAASGAADGSGNTTAPLALTTSIANSTCATAANRVVISETDGKLNQTCLDLADDFNFTGGAGAVKVGTTTPPSGYVFVVDGNAYIGATTTIDALEFATTSPYIKVRNVYFHLPTSDGTSGQVLKTDGTGTLSFGNPGTSALTLIPPPKIPIYSENSVSMDDNTQIRLGQYILEQPMTINKLSFYVTSHTTAGTVDFTVYSEDGQTQHFSETTGSVTGTGLFTQTLSQARTLAAGTYYFGLGTNSTTSFVVATYSATSTVAKSISDAVSSEPDMYGFATQSAGVPPSTITVTSLDLTSDEMPIYRFDN